MTVEEYANATAKQAAMKAAEMQKDEDISVIRRALENNTISKEAAEILISQIEHKD